MPSWDRLLSLCRPTAQLARGNGTRRIGRANTEMTNPRTASTPAAVEGDPCEHHATLWGATQRLKGTAALEKHRIAALGWRDKKPLLQTGRVEWREGGNAIGEGQPSRRM